MADKGSIHKGGKGGKGGHPGGHPGGKGGKHSKAGKSQKGKKGCGQGVGPGGAKPSDDPSFVHFAEGSVIRGSARGVEYIIEAYVASGTFSRVYRVIEVSEENDAGSQNRRWVARRKTGTKVFAAKVMRKTDTYIQYTSDACREGDLLQLLEQKQVDEGNEVLTMRCFDSFATQDDAGTTYWCLILEWLQVSLFDIVRGFNSRGLHLSLVAVLLRQLLEQLRVLEENDCTHTDIKHKNCCLADASYFLVNVNGEGQRQTPILTNPLAKFIDYGNAVFEGEAKVHPIHTKQFRAPEVLLNVQQGWGPPSDIWTLGITAAFLVCGQLIFNSHDPAELIRQMVDALGPFSAGFLGSAKDQRLRRVAEHADVTGKQSLPVRLQLTGFPANSPESSCCELLRKMLEPNPVDRVKAVEALQHPFLAPGSTPSLPVQPEDAEVRQV